MARQADTSLCRAQVETLTLDTRKVNKAFCRRQRNGLCLADQQPANVVARISRGGCFADVFSTPSKPN